jgi:hypothetical protein
MFLFLTAMLLYSSCPENSMNHAATFSSKTTTLLTAMLLYSPCPQTFVGRAATFSSKTTALVCYIVTTTALWTCEIAIAISANSYVMAGIIRDLS